jgi:hypothetical protein
MSAVERSAMRKVYLRLLPFGCLCMIVCYLDRINVGFAALSGSAPRRSGLAPGAFMPATACSRSPATSSS